MARDTRERCERGQFVALPDQFFDQDVDDIGQLGFGAGGVGGYSGKPFLGLCVRGSNIDELAQDLLVS
jgi:hypothetical protein